MGKNHTEEFQVNPNQPAGVNPAAPYGWVQNIGKADPNNATLTTCCAQPGTFSDGGREDAVDGLGQLWVADMPNFRSQVWSVSGTKNTFLFDAPSATSPQLPAAGAFSYPEGVGVAGDGTIVVSDSHNFRLEFFDAATSSTPYALDTADGSSTDPRRGGFARAPEQLQPQLRAQPRVQHQRFELGLRGFLPGRHLQQQRPRLCGERHTRSGHTAATAPAGSTDRMQPAIAKIANTSVKSPLALPSGVAVDNSTGPNAGDIYIADSGDKRVVVISPAGTLLSYFSITQFKDPRGLALDPSTGDLYVADFSGATVYKFSISGVWGSTTTPGPPPS